MPKNAKALVKEANEFFSRADAEGRDLTAEERVEVSELLDAAQAQKAIEQKIKAVGGEGFFTSLATLTDPNADVGGSDPGSRFVNSQGYKAIKDPGARGETWTSGLVEVGPPIQMKGTLLEGAGNPGSGTGGGFAPVPQVADGIVSTLFQPLTLESLLLSGQASSQTVRFATP